MALRFDESIDPERFAYDVLTYQLPRFRFPRDELPSTTLPTNNYRWFSDQIPTSCRTLTVMGLSARDVHRTAFEADFKNPGLDDIEKLTKFFRRHCTFRQAQCAFEINNVFIMRTAASLAVLVELALFLQSKKLVPLVECLPKIWAEYYNERLKKKLEKIEGGLNSLKRLGDVQTRSDRDMKEFINTHAKNYGIKVSELFENMRSVMTSKVKRNFTDVLIIDGNYKFLDLQKDIERKKNENLKAGIVESEDDDDEDNTPEMSLTERLGGILPSTH